MFNIHDAHNMQRVLPQHLEDLLSERDQLLNRLPSDKLLGVYEAKECRVFVDRTLALRAAGAGLPVSRLATIFSLVFPLMIVASITSFFVWGWQASALFGIAAIVAFRASRHFTIEDVRNAALNDEKLLTLLMSNGAIWFEMADKDL